MRTLGKKTPFLLVTVCLAILAACSSSRVLLPPYSPFPDSTVHMPERDLVVTTLSDHRFRLYSFGANTTPDMVGWGQGTGTLITPENVARHVSEAIARQYREFGSHAVYRSDVRCRISKNDDGTFRARVPVPGPVICGSILDYQFQIEHPRVGLGPEISTLDMAAGVTLKAQVALHLFLVRGGTILWQGVVFDADGARDVHGPRLREKAVAILERTLGITLEKSALKVSGALVGE